MGTYSIIKCIGSLSVLPGTELLKPFNFLGDSSVFCYSKSTPSTVCFFTIILFTYFFIFGCAGSSCCPGFSLVAVSGAPAAVQGFSSRGPSRRRARAGGARFQELRLTGSGAQTQELRCTGLAPPRHVGSSWLRDRTRASCTDRQILYH